MSPPADIGYNRVTEVKVLRSLVLLSVILLPSTTSPRPAQPSGPCSYKVTIRVDENFSDEERAQIKAATHDWFIASGSRLCFTLTFFTPTRLEFSIYRSDGYSSIYSPRTRWVPPYVTKAGCDYNQDACMAITVRGKTDPPTADVLVGTINEKFPSLIKHELGHLLGLPHSPSESDLMWFKIRKDTPISSRDKAVLNCLLKPGRLLRWNTACTYPPEGGPP